MHPDHHHADTAGLAAPHAAASVHPADLASPGAAGAAPAGLKAPPDVQTPGGNPASTEHETVGTADFASKPRQAQELSRTDKTRTKHLPSLHAVQGFARQVGAI